VAQLDERQLDDLAVYLNFDMVASPNYVRFIYGSGEVREVFENFFGSLDLKAETVDLKGRSDHGPFAAEGIPVGGLFSGAEGRKTGSRPRSTAARRASPSTGATTKLATT
jgi:Zn-dependent M28 family amino/carboxypeptidase